MLYTSSSFVLSTIFLASSAVNDQLTFIDDRNFPGGPNAFTLAEYSITVNFLGNVCAILMGLLADGLLVCYPILHYRSSESLIFLVLNSFSSGEGWSSIPVPHGDG